MVDFVFLFYNTKVFDDEQVSDEQSSFALWDWAKSWETEFVMFLKLSAYWVFKISDLSDLGVPVRLAARLLVWSGNAGPLTGIYAHANLT